MFTQGKTGWFAPIVIGMLTTMFHCPDWGVLGPSVDRPAFVDIAGLPSGRPIKTRGDHRTDEAVVLDAPTPGTSVPS